MRTPFRILGIAAALAFNSVSQAGTPSNWDFFNGSAAEGNFTPAVTRGATKQAVGRVSILADAFVSQVQQVIIDLQGVRTGLTNFKFWTSNDAVLDAGDPQFGSTVAADPGNGSSVTFNGTWPNPSSGTFYFFLTADVNASASGSVLPRVTVFQVFGTMLNGFTPPEQMATSAVPVPVTISGFRLE